MFAPTQDWTEALATAEEKLKLPKRECDVNFSLGDIEQGNINIIFAHPESLSSAKGSKILEALQN
jgi:hypothetical protein